MTTSSTKTSHLLLCHLGVMKAWEVQIIFFLALSGAQGVTLLVCPSSTKHYGKCYYIKLFCPSPPKKQIYVCRMPYLVWFWIYWFMKHGLSDLKIKIKSWKILFFEDNFGNLGDKWVQLFFFLVRF